MGYVPIRWRLALARSAADSIDIVLLWERESVSGATMARIAGWSRGGWQHARVRRGRVHRPSEAMVGSAHDRAGQHDQTNPATCVSILRWSRNREAGDNHQGRKHHAAVALHPL